MILPATALAAATAGLARYTSESTCPIRPTKFRLVVEMHLSPAAKDTHVAAQALDRR